MTLTIGNEEYKDVASFFTEYQKDNGRSHWVFITTESGEHFAVNYEPRKETIAVL